jgi:tetratricopeptide (TPR) repeat protein
MSTLYFKAFKICILASALGLVACNEQSIKPAPEEMKATQAPDATPTASTEKPAIPAEPTTKAVVPESSPKEEEPPAVEVTPTPRKSAGEYDIAIDAIPAAQETAQAQAAERQEPESSAVEEKKQEVAAPAPEDPALAPSVVLKETEKETSADSETGLASTGPNHFVLTSALKDASHPFYGKGHAIGFLVDGAAGKELVVERGQTYTFEVDTGPRHDIYLSKKEIGWGGAPLAKGVEGAYVHKGRMTFKPTADTPDNIYYACRDHPYMGGTIHVVNPGEKLVLKEHAASGSSKKSAGPSVTEAKVKQKLVFAEMIINSQTAKRVMASQNDEAKKILENARKILAEGKEKSKAGALSEALDMFNRSLKMMREAKRLVPTNADIAQLAESYKEMLTEIKDYQKSHKDNIKHMEKTGAIPDEARYDEEAFSQMLAEAQSLADKKDYAKANVLLKQAQKVVTEALHKMLDSKTLVYDLNFETPADEFAYELKRFSGYEELIPVAIEAKKPAAGAIKLMDSFLNKGRKRRDEAQTKADAGDYDAAIAMLQQATKSVRRALRMVGVAQ